MQNHDRRTSCRFVGGGVIDFEKNATDGFLLLCDGGVFNCEITTDGLVAVLPMEALSDPENATDAVDCLIDSDKRDGRLLVG